MKLIDFTQNQEFNDLRHKIGTDDLGRFELFDPKKHLTWQEKKSLSENWVNVSVALLHAQSDKTLAYKNSYILSVVGDEVHFAYCDALKNKISKGSVNSIDVSLNWELFKGKSVCSYCLHAISYEGFDVYRHRHQEYNQKIVQSFKLDNYLTHKYGKPA